METPEQERAMRYARAALDAVEASRVLGLQQIYDAILREVLVDANKAPRGAVTVRGEPVDLDAIKGPRKLPPIAPAVAKAKQAKVAPQAVIEAMARAGEQAYTQRGGTKFFWHRYARDWHGLAKWVVANPHEGDLHSTYVGRLRQYFIQQSNPGYVPANFVDWSTDVRLRWTHVKYAMQYVIRDFKERDEPSHERVYNLKDIAKAGCTAICDHHNIDKDNHPNLGWQFKEHAWIAAAEAFVDMSGSRDIVMWAMRNAFDKASVAKGETSYFDGKPASEWRKVDREAWGSAFSGMASAAGM